MQDLILKIIISTLMILISPVIAFFLLITIIFIALEFLFTRERDISKSSSFWD